MKHDLATQTAGHKHAVSGRELAGDHDVTVGQTVSYFIQSDWLTGHHITKLTTQRVKS